jgi:hypothetical protein
LIALSIILFYVILTVFESFLLFISYDEERWRDGEMERWRDGEMERWRDVGWMYR